jgi:hypothetical protein
MNKSRRPKDADIHFPSIQYAHELVSLASTTPICFASAALMRVPLAALVPLAPNAQNASTACMMRTGPDVANVPLARQSLARNWVPFGAALYSWLRVRVSGAERTGRVGGPGALPVSAELGIDGVEGVGVARVQTGRVCQGRRGCRGRDHVGGEGEGEKGGTHIGCGWMGLARYVEAQFYTTPVPRHVLVRWNRIYH